MSTENLGGRFWTIISIFFYLMVFTIIIFLLISFNLVPNFILRFLRNAKEDYIIVKILYHFLYALPCLLGDMLRGLFGGGNEMINAAGNRGGLILICLLVLLLLPCIIRYLYLRTPWGMSQLMKTSYKMKLENAKKAVDSLENTIQIRRLMTPGIKWNENWLRKTENEAERNVMRAELLKLNYRRKEKQEKVSKKIKNLLFDLARCYITPSFPFYPIYNLKNSLNKTLKPIRPEIEKTLTYINKNIDEMQVDLKLLPKLRDDYNTLKDNYQDYIATFKTKQLINEPIYTDREKTSDDWYFENLKEGRVYNYSYAVSCWIFIHQQPPSRGSYYSSIFNYGDKPNILYNMDKQKLRITMRKKLKKDKIIFETEELPMQKWNNILINYDGGTLDLYINNELVASEPGVIPYLSQDKITMGQENGLSGGICNVVYFPEALSVTKMSLFYESLKNLNPPTLPYCFF